jgi:hypothetical protein
MFNFEQVWSCQLLFGKYRGCRSGAKICSVAPDNTKEGFIDVDSAVILELLGGIALREDGCFILEFGDFSSESGCPEIVSRQTQGHLPSHFEQTAGRL